MSQTQWYIGAPNGVILCVNECRGGVLKGELFHSYSREPQAFADTEQMLLLMEDLYNTLNFPHLSTNERTFSLEKKKPEPKTERIKIMRDEELLSRHGDIGTFIVRVQHRQNSSWQGRITWMEQDKTINFRSVWEMIKLIESAVNTVGDPEEQEEPISWE